MLPIGPDKGWSWIIVVCCAYLHFASVGLSRSSGVMYVAILNHYVITREEASWPFSLFSAVTRVSAPFGGILLHYFTLRKSCIIGSAVGTLGLVCCYFAKTILWVNIFYGVLYGVGFGLVSTFVPVIANQYFVKYRATAMGIAFSGAPVSSFILPTAIEYLLEKYGLSGTFLILGGVIMNSIVASAFLRTPPWLNEEVEGADSNNRSSLNKQDRTFEKGTSTNTSDNHEIPKTDSAGRNFEEGISFLDGEKESAPVLKKQFRVPHYQNKDNRSELLQSVIDIFHNSMFFVLALTTVVFVTSTQIFFLVIIDFGKDNGIPEQEIISAIGAFSVTDLIGRLGFGWITDKGYIKTKNLLIVNMVLLGVLYQLYSIVNNLTGILVVASINGWCVGTTATRLHILQADYIGLKRFALAIGLNKFITGMCSFLRPIMIGSFRDIIGTYNWLFRFLGSLFFLVSAVWLFEPLLKKKYDDEHLSKGETSENNVQEVDFHLRI